MPEKLEIHERFKDARIVYNKNGKQTMNEVANATGIQKSMLSSLEKDDTRGASFRDVAKLAYHYGVSMDWLCGLSNVRSSNTDVRDICDRTGLNEASVSFLFSNNKEVTNFINCLLALPTDLLNSIAESYSYCAFLKAFIDNRKSNSEVHISTDTKYPWGAWIFHNESIDDGLDFLQYKLSKKINEAINDSAFLYKTGKIKFMTSGGNRKS